MIAMPQATAALYIPKFTKYLVNLIDIYWSLVKINKRFFLTVCEIFFKLKFSKSILNIKTLDVFGKFLLIV
jgi:hypothetical protein